MSWNYRVILDRWTNKDGEIEECYEIHEVYYNDKTGKIKNISKDAQDPHGSTLGELVESLRAMLRATEKPILEEAFDKGGRWIVREVKE